MTVHVILEIDGTGKRVEVEPMSGQDPVRNFEEAQKEMDGLVRLGRAVFRVSHVAGVLTYEDNDVKRTARRASG